MEFGASPSIISEYGQAKDQQPTTIKKSTVNQLGPSLRPLRPSCSITFISARSPRKFVGATQITLTNFDPKSDVPQMAMLLLDNNNVTYSKFGEPRVTIAYYKPFEIKLTRLRRSDATGMNRCMFSVELPKEYVHVLGESSLRLVIPLDNRSGPAGVRLLLINVQGMVTGTLELSPPVDYGEFDASMIDFAQHSE